MSKARIMYLSMSIISVMIVAGLNVSCLKVTSLSKDGELVFITPASGSVNHHYRVESTPSLINRTWTTRRSVSGVGPAESVTNLFEDTASSMFYRMVSSSNSAAFVDGEYMVIDLSGGTNASFYAVTYFTGAAALPGGITDDVYKTEKLLMRRIPKGMFTMGSPSEELGRSIVETQHRVTLTKDFYMGVFEVTQRQWELVMGNRPSQFNNEIYYQSRPVESVSYYEIRENPDNSAISPNWPVSSQVHAESFMGRLRAKTGLSDFDLPTEAQWEHACRAGTTAALNSGHNLTSIDNDLRMADVGRYLYNGGMDVGQWGCDPKAGTALVGSYLPNAWGLYDMHGNVREWCLDWSGPYPSEISDPSGVVSGKLRLYRGGSWERIALHCRSGSRDSYYPFGLPNKYVIGFRVARTLP